MYEHKVVEWRECHDFMKEKYEDCEASESRHYLLALMAIDEHYDYWARVCQPDLFD